jgi:hypothetical protein
MKLAVQVSILAAVFQLGTLKSCGTPVESAKAGEGPVQSTLHEIRSMPLSQFQASLGVATHIEYTDGKYADVQRVLADLRYLGIMNVRDGIPNPHWLPEGQGLAAIKLLSAHGVRFDLLSSCNSNGIEETMVQVDALAREFRGVALSVEGTNEINNEACTVGGGSNEENGQAWQQKLYKAVHADPLLQNIPVLYMTGAAPKADLSGFADEANTHPYPSAGVQPHARLMSDFISDFPGLSAKAPKQITETGYATDLSDNGNAVDEATQATLGLNIYFDAAFEGIGRAYLYQLLEAYPKPSGDTSLGLFRYDGTPKMLAVNLHNLSVLMPEDAVSSARQVQGVVTGMPSTAYQLALTASDGSIYVFAWNEVPVWDPVRKASLPYSHVRYQVKMAGNWRVESLNPTQASPGFVEDSENGAFSAWLETYPTALHFIPQKNGR